MTLVQRVKEMLPMVVDKENVRGLSGRYPVILNISRTGRVALM
jgi:hypothetical protein